MGIASIRTINLGACKVAGGHVRAIVLRTTHRNNSGWGKAAGVELGSAVAAVQTHVGSGEVAPAIAVNTAVVTHEEIVFVLMHIGHHVVVGMAVRHGVPGTSAVGASRDVHAAGYNAVAVGIGNTQHYAIGLVTAADSSRNGAADPALAAVRAFHECGSIGTETGTFEQGIHHIREGAAVVKLNAAVSALCRDIAVYHNLVCAGIPARAAVNSCADAREEYTTVGAAHYV